MKECLKDVKFVIRSMSTKLMLKNIYLKLMKRLDMLVPVVVFIAKINSYI